MSARVQSINPSKTGYHHGNLKQALLDASVLILKEKGLENLTLREAARRAGVSQAAPYRHFENKEALIANLVKHGYGKIESKIDQRWISLSADSSAMEKLVQMGLAYLDFAFESPDYFHLLINMDSKKTQANEGLKAENDRLIERGMGLITQMQSDGLGVGRCQKQIFSNYLALCLGFSTLYISGRSTMLQVDKSQLQKLFRENLENAVRQCD